MASPRRALAPLDANKPAPSPVKAKSLPGLLPPVLASPARERKRALEVEERVVKRSCTGTPRPTTARPISPDASVFEDSTRTTFDADSTRASVFEDSTRTTSVFDADTTRSTASSVEDRQRAQARKMAGDLLARLRLAKYKVRTGQAHVPFPQLEARPRVEVRAASPGPDDMDDSERGDAEREGDTGGTARVRTGQGAASLLSLSQGSQ